MTVNGAFKKRVRARMADTGEKYTEARRAILEEDEAFYADSIAREAAALDEPLAAGEDED